MTDMGVDSAFLRKENKLLDMKVKCRNCGGRIKLFVNDMASPGEVWPFCDKCESYVDVVPDE
jgi:hypothetical protein